MQLWTICALTAAAVILGQFALCTLTAAAVILGQFALWTCVSTAIMGNLDGIYEESG